LEIKNDLSDSIVAGSTGLVGSELVKELVRLGHVVTALTRRKTIPMLEQVEYKFVDYEKPSSFEYLFQNKKHVFICLGTTIKKAGSKENFRRVDIDYSFDIAKIASKFNVPNLSLVTSIGADSTSKNFYLQCKGEIENKILTLDFESVSIYQPGLLIGARSEKRIGESLGQTIQPFFIDPLLQGSLKKFRSIKATYLAKSIASNSGKKSGKRYLTFEDFFLLS